MPIEELREKIDRIDERILGLLEERVDIVKKIGAVKRKKGLPIDDIDREREVVGRLTGRTKLNKHFVRRIYENVIEYCKENER